MTALLAVVVAADAVIAILWLRPAVLREGLIPLAGVLIYLAAFHICGSPSNSEGNSRRMSIHGRNFSHGLAATFPARPGLGGLAFFIFAWRISSRLRLGSGASSNRTPHP